jgi:hypothetical protein
MPPDELLLGFLLAHYLFHGLLGRLLLRDLLGRLLHNLLRGLLRRFLLGHHTSSLVNYGRASCRRAGWGRHRADLSPRKLFMILLIPKIIASTILAEERRFLRDFLRAKRARRRTCASSRRDVSSLDGRAQRIQTTRTPLSGAPPCACPRDGNPPPRERRRADIIACDRPPPSNARCRSSRPHRSHSRAGLRLAASRQMARSNRT